jgi:hypothetical protein
MTDQELAELQKPDTWADEPEGVRPPVKSPRAVVSVAFSREDLQQVERFARERGMRTSEFIRKAALEQASPSGASRPVTVSGGTIRTDVASVTSSAAKAKVTTTSALVHTTA